jgi:glycosyltransferase involved in cell wall biosynthesis
MSIESIGSTLDAASPAGKSGGPRRLLMVAYHFPPLQGSSGIQRTLRFAQHLPRFGWQPIVLTVQPRAYERTSADLNADIPSDVVVHRAFALDAARHLSIKGRYVGWTARPDRWISWRLDGVRAGLGLVRQFRPQALWSTYPIATAHVIAASLHRRTGLPWIADFRDPMAQDGYPADPKTWASYKAIEEHTVRTADCSMFTTPGAAREYQRRYPEIDNRIRVLENGYDEESFVAAEAASTDRTPLREGRFTLLHSGIVYPSERDPTQLIRALALLRKRDTAANRLIVRFRASAHDDMLRTLARDNGVEDMIELMPAVSYREALAEMLRADALLVLQASNCNEQIPAKLYEYLRSGRPIAALTDPQGDTAEALRRSGVTESAPLDDAHAIVGFLEKVASGQHAGLRPSPAAITAASRKGRTEALVQALDSICAKRAVLPGSRC